MILDFFRNLFVPHGNLLVRDIVAEVTLHVMDDGQRKAIVSKFEDTPDHRLRQALVQHLIFTGIDVARERGIGINWEAVARAYPFQPAPPPPAPAPRPSSRPSMAGSAPGGAGPRPPAG